jgi:HAMP domain-containing protein
MIKLLTLLLSLIERFFGAQEAAKLRQEGRQEAIKEINDAINHQIELGEAAIAVPDPERDERLRNRFDRSRGAK